MLSLVHRITSGHNVNYPAYYLFNLDQLVFLSRSLAVVIVVSDVFFVCLLNKHLNYFEETFSCLLKLLILFGTISR